MKKIIVITLLVLAVFAEVTINFASDVKIINLAEQIIVWHHDDAVDRWKLEYTVDANQYYVDKGFVSIMNLVPSINLDHDMIKKKMFVGTYYFDDGGYMHKGWLKNGNDYYYFDTIKTEDQGKLVNGWKKIDNAYYYFDESGKMLKDVDTIDGYHINGQGQACDKKTGELISVSNESQLIIDTNKAFSTNKDSDLSPLDDKSNRCQVLDSDDGPVTPGDNSMFSGVFSEKFGEKTKNSLFYDHNSPGGEIGANEALIKGMNVISY